MEASTDTQARRGGDCGRAIHGGEAMAALGCSGERGGDGFGGERERRRSRGECGGEWGGETEGARRGDLIPSSRRRRGGVRLGRALFRPGSGEQGKGTRCGSWAGWAGQAGCGPGGWAVAVRVGWAAWSRGLPPPPFFVISFFYLFPFLFYLVLGHLGIL